MVPQDRARSFHLMQAALVRAAFEPREVHAVVTVRDLARQLPSAWQQRVKGRGRMGLDAFVDNVRERTPADASFWRHHDVVEVLDPGSLRSRFRRRGGSAPPR